MSYCVHCGVKLGGGEKRCPLCHTPVRDPLNPPDASAPRAYPVRSPEQELKRSKGYLIAWAAILLLVPSLLCLLIDGLTAGFGWSIYASGALILLFISVAAPLALPRRLWWLSVLISFLCLNTYLFLAEQISRSPGWYFPIVFPALALFFGMAVLLIILFRRDRLNKLTVFGASLIAIAAQCLFVEWLCGRAEGKPGGLMWSPYVMAPCLFIGLVIFFINGNRPIREEIRRWVHF